MKILLSEDGKQVVGVEIDENVWPLKKPMPLSELSELTKHIKYVTERFDFGKEKEWADSDLSRFLEKELTERQQYFMSILAQSEGWTPLDAIVELYSKKYGEAWGVTIAGLQAPLTRKCRNLKKENFWQSKYVEEESKYYYRIKPGYSEVVKKALKRN